MKSKNTKMQEFWECISLRDKCLIIFMIVLMAQLASSLFINSSSMYAPSVNIVTRTTISAIFGYFISSNFVSRRDASNKYKNRNKNNKDNTGKIKCICELEEKVEEEINKEINEEMNADMEEGQTKGQQTEDRVQIMIISTIGLVSLMIVFLAHNLSNLPEDALVTLSQYRSIISGCVGFLIGMPPEKNSRR